MNVKAINGQHEIAEKQINRSISRKSGQLQMTEAKKVEGRMRKVPMSAAEDFGRVTHNMFESSMYLNLSSCLLELKYIRNLFNQLEYEEAVDSLPCSIAQSEEARGESLLVVHNLKELLRSTALSEAERQEYMAETQAKLESMLLAKRAQKRQDPEVLHILDTFARSYQFVAAHAAGEEPADVDQTVELGGIYEKHSSSVNLFDNTVITYLYSDGESDELMTLIVQVNLKRRIELRVFNNDCKAIYFKEIQTYLQSSFFDFPFRLVTSEGQPIDQSSSIVPYLKGGIEVFVSKVLSEEPPEKLRSIVVLDSSNSEFICSFTLCEDQAFDQLIEPINKYLVEALKENQRYKVVKRKPFVVKDLINPLYLDNQSKEVALVEFTKQDREKAVAAVNYPYLATLPKEVGFFLKIEKLIRFNSKVEKVIRVEASQDEYLYDQGFEAWFRKAMDLGQEGIERPWRTPDILVMNVRKWDPTLIDLLLINIRSEIFMTEETLSSDKLFMLRGIVKCGKEGRYDSVINHQEFEELESGHKVMSTTQGLVGFDKKATTSEGILVVYELVEKERSQEGDDENY